MQCQDIKNRFPDFLIGDLDPKTKDEIQSHITLCASCREELENLSSIWSKLGVLPVEKPSDALRTRFYTMLEDYKERLEQKKEQPFWKRFEGWFDHFWPRRPALQLSLSLLFLLVGVVVGYFLISTGQSSMELTNLRQEVQNMNKMLASSLLNQRSPSGRIKGIHLSYDLEEPEPEILDKLIYVLNNDSNINVRLAAVDALYLFRDEPLVRNGLIESLPQQSSPLVQIALIDLVTEIRESRAAEALKQLIQDERLNTYVKNRAEQSIQALSF
jgi:hypothetical protein